MDTDGNILDVAARAFQIEGQCLLEAFGHIDGTEFKKAVAALAAAPRIGASGCGHTGIACRHFAHLMCCIERPARFISPAEAVHGGTGFLQKDDVLVVASRGGKTAELLPIIDIARKRNAFVISVTENSASPMAQLSDVTLPMSVYREADRYNAQGTSSFVALASVFDALQVAVMEETGFRGEQFALIHPGGAVGERLNR